MRTICESCTSAPASRVACGLENTALCGACDNTRYIAVSVFDDDTRHPLQSVIHRPCLTKPVPPRSPNNSVQGDRISFCAETTAPLPCDICKAQEAVAVCHEDRAFLCRSCDASIHGDNEHVAQHTRFLLTGVRLENMSVGGGVGSKKRKAIDMARAPGQLNDTFQTQSGATRRISIPQSHDSDFGIVPVFSEHFREQQVPEVFVHDTSMSYQNGITDSVTDAFEQEFLAGSRKNQKNQSGYGDLNDDFINAFFDDGDDFGVVPVF